MYIWLQLSSHHITGYQWSCWSSRSPRPPWSACKSSTDSVIHLDSTPHVEWLCQTAVLMFCLMQGPQGPKGAKGSSVSRITVCIVTVIISVYVKCSLDHMLPFMSLPGSCRSKRRHWCSWSSWSSCECLRPLLLPLYKLLTSIFSYQI